MIDRLITADDILVRARLLSRAVTGIYDFELRRFKISSSQFALLALISQTQPITRAEIARIQHLDKSTLTRNLRAFLSEKWVQEVSTDADGRSRPLALTNAGTELLLNARPAWVAARAHTRALLGKDGMNALIKTADRILDGSDYSNQDCRSEHNANQA